MSTKNENNSFNGQSTYAPSTRTNNVPPTYVPISESQIISILEGYGFEIKGKYIQKRSHHNRLEVCGNLNEHSIYFHATNNIYPFETGVSYSFKSLLKGFNTSLVSEYELAQITKRRIQEKRQEKPKQTIDFDEYLKTTNENHNFNLQNLINSFHNNKEENLIYVPSVWNNENNVRAKWNKTYFPLLNEQNKLITAQIIEYKSDLKRNREGNIYFLPSSGNIGLYRRNLYDETLKTIIVESPKLAELGALILPKFNWLATFGKEKLNTLDLSFLNPGQTYLLADFDAFSEWKEIGKNKWNFNVIDIFQKEIAKLNLEEQKKYSDFADLILPYLQVNCDVKIKAILYKIYISLINLQLEDVQLLEVNSPQIESYNSELGFGEKKRKNIKFISSIPKDFCENTRGLYKQSGEGGYSIKTNFIEVFTNDFELISASFDICKEQTEEQFVLNLQNCYRVLRYLNEKSYLALFDVILAHIQTKGNYLFNQGYVRDVLMEQWEEIDALYIEDLIKKRNFNYLGGADFNNYEFLAEIRKAKKLYKIHSELHAIKGIVKNGIAGFNFIDKKELGLKKEIGNEYIFNLINRFNLASVGSADVRMARVVQTLVTFNITIYKGYYYLHKEKISINKVFEITDINRRTLTHLMKFERNTEIIENILNEIEFLTDNYNSFSFNRVENKGKIYNSVVPIFEKAIEVVCGSLNDAFDYELDLKDSILTCDVEEAYNRGMNFYVSWYFYQNKIYNDSDRNYIRDYKYELFHRNWNPMELEAA